MSIKMRPVLPILKKKTAKAKKIEKRKRRMTPQSYPDIFDYHKYVFHLKKLRIQCSGMIFADHERGLIFLCQNKFEDNHIFEHDKLGFTNSLLVGDCSPDELVKLDIFKFRVHTKRPIKEVDYYTFVFDIPKIKIDTLGGRKIFRERINILINDMVEINQKKKIKF